MKTAISIPDPLFERADALARRLRVSRSELYARAVAIFVAENDEASDRAALDALYAVEPSTLPEGAEASQARIASGWED